MPADGLPQCLITLMMPGTYDGALVRWNHPIVNLISETNVIRCRQWEGEWLEAGPLMSLSPDGLEAVIGWPFQEGGGDWELIVPVTAYESPGYEVNVPQGGTWLTVPSLKIDWASGSAEA